MSTTVSERQSSASNPFQPPQSARGIQRQFSNGCLVVLATVFATLRRGRVGLFALVCHTQWHPLHQPGFLHQPAHAEW